MNKYSVNESFTDECKRVFIHHRDTALLRQKDIENKSFNPKASIINTEAKALEHYQALIDIVHYPTMIAMLMFLAIDFYIKNKES